MYSTIVTAVNTNLNFEAFIHSPVARSVSSYLDRVVKLVTLKAEWELAIVLSSNSLHRCYAIAGGCIVITGVCLFVCLSQGYLSFLLNFDQTCQVVWG